MKSVKSTIMALATFCAMATASLTSAANTTARDANQFQSETENSQASNAGEDLLNKNLPKLTGQHFKILKEQLDIRPYQEAEWNEFIAEMNGKNIKVQKPRNLHTLPQAERYALFKAISESQRLETQRKAVAIKSFYQSLDQWQKQRFDELGRKIMNS